MNKHRLLSILAAGLAIAPLASADLVMHFPMEARSGRLVEQVSNSRFAINGQFSAENVPGAVGQALRFDGYTTRIDGSISNSVPEDTKQMTISMWVAIQAYPIVLPDVYTTDRVNIFSCLDEANKSGFSVGISFEGKWTFKTYVGGWPVEVNIDTPMPTYQWNNIVAVIDCSSARKLTLYLNGEEVGSSRVNGTLKLGPGNLIIGHNASDNYLGEFCTTAFNGVIDEVQVWDEIVDLATIQSWSPENEADLSIPESRFADDLLRPRFHGMPDAGWTNECHGMVYSAGRYHVFFQKNANGPYMCRLHWGHISSENLYDWREEPIAIMPGDYYDIKGCWSGAVFTDPVIGNGRPYIIYTGVDYGHASIIGATPKNDALLQWTKQGELIPNRPDGLSDDFRDPYFFRNGDNAYIIVGTNKDGVGACTLHRYNASNGSWSNDGSIFFRGSNSAQDGFFWEMSNITQMANGKWLFTATPLGASSGVRSLYWTGSINADGTFAPDANFPFGKPIELSNGNGFGLLSPTVYNHDGKTLCLGIVPDILGGGDNYRLGWAHCYSLPREWTLGTDGLLEQKPYSGLVGLRSATSFSKSNFSLSGNMDLGEVSGRAVELCGVFTIGSGPFGFKFFKGGSGEASIYYNPTSNSVVLDCSRLYRIVNDGGSFNGLYTMPLPEVLPTGSELKLDVFIDHSIVDVFVNDRWASSVRIFPTENDADGVQAYATNGDVTVKSLNAWVLDPKSSGGIADITVDENAPVEFFNLQGVRVSGDLTPGLYIRRQGSIATKIAVK